MKFSSGSKLKPKTLKPKSSRKSSRRVEGLGSIGIVAPSAKVPKVELDLGVAKIKAAGFEVHTHPQCRKSHLFFAGTDEERASALMDYAKNPDVSVIWCARGGSGAIRVLPLLDRWRPASRGRSRKLLIGYSDATALMDYVHRKWGWSILHAPMPSMRKFSILENADWAAIQSWIRKEHATAPWGGLKLEFWSRAPKKSVSGPLVGGNLTVWNGLLGTPYAPKPGKSLLFFEDIDEAHYRIDRMVQQQILSGAWDQVRAIVLGNFLNCRDYAPSVLKSQPNAESLSRLLSAPEPEELQPLRATLEQKEGLRKIWTDVGQRLGIPVAFGLPVGHGPEVSPLPLGADYRLTPKGILELVNWDWFNK